ncbi:hypothetical protein DPMN_086702 [Dreissena polymorpha]|uniref:Uncharacterized protein n=1 Tax=Dreissena polymorpha TaxID=45954 RepID=A0A9D4KRX3_DREPO|nr:hypothetical protein DPMN_086702 [Dreissena polymorpha]
MILMMNKQQHNRTDIPIQLLTKFGEDWMKVLGQTDRQSDSHIAPLPLVMGMETTLIIEAALIISTDNMETTSENHSIRKLIFKFSAPVTYRYFYLLQRIKPTALGCLLTSMWLKEHPILYNKKLSSYKDKAKKGTLWNKQAVLLEKDFSILHGKDDPELANPDEIQGRSTSITNADQPTILDAKLKQSRVSQEKERLLNTLDERGCQSIKVQEKFLEMVKPPSAPSERDTFGDWVKSVMVDLGPSLWRQFQQEQTSLLYKYLDLNDQVCSQMLQPQQQQLLGTPQPPHQQWQPGQQTQSSQQPHWQRFPDNWSTTMSATMVQGKPQNEPVLTTLQPLQSTPKNPPQNICAASPQNEDTSISGCLSNSFMEMLNQNK